MDEFKMRAFEVGGSLTGASPVTTILAQLCGMPRSGAKYSSDRACPCQALDDLFFPQSNLNNPYPDAYGVCGKDILPTRLWTTSNMEGNSCV